MAVTSRLRAGIATAPSGRDAGRQQLDEDGRAVFDAVDADDGGALGEDEEVVAVAEAGELEALGLGALGVGPAFRVVADRGDRVLEAAPLSKATLPSRLKTVKPRLPPFQSPSLAVASRSVRIH